LLPCCQHADVELIAAAMTVFVNGCGRLDVSVSRRDGDSFVGNYKVPKIVPRYCTDSGAECKTWVFMTSSGGARCGLASQPAKFWSEQPSFL
jgi:hypothetical protein